jgi:FAD/FMN-containing dehydrogenase
MMKAVNDIAAKYRLEVGTFGHAGDGNLHPTFLCDKRDADEFRRVEEAIDEMFDTSARPCSISCWATGISARWPAPPCTPNTVL